MLALFYEHDMPCQGSTAKDVDGEYAFVKETLKWLNRRTRRDMDMFKEI